MPQVFEVKEPFQKLMLLFGKLWTVKPSEIVRKVRYI